MDTVIDYQKVYLRKLEQYFLGNIGTHTLADLTYIMDHSPFKGCSPELIRMARLLEDVRDVSGRVKPEFIEKRRKQVFLNDQFDFFHGLHTLNGDIRIIGKKDQYGYYPVAYGHSGNFFEFARMKFKEEHDPNIFDHAIPDSVMEAITG